MERETLKKSKENMGRSRGILKEDRIIEAEEWIRDLEDKIVEITTKEQNKEKRMKRIEDSLRDLWDNIKRTNIRIIGAPEEEEKKKGAEKIFEGL